MKKGFVFLIVSVILFSCDKANSDANKITQTNTPEENRLIGNWKLIENLLDPGDGSGVFQAVVSEKTIVFNNDGTVISNGSLCDLTAESATASNGTYSITDSIINSASCGVDDLNIHFNLTDSNLILSYECIEPCKAKFIKVE